MGLGQRYRWCPDCRRGKTVEFKGNPKQKGSGWYCNVCNRRFSSRDEMRRLEGE